MSHNVNYELAQQTNPDRGSDDEHRPCLPAQPGSQGHMLSSSDPDSPMQWPISKKVYTSVVASFFAFTM